MRSSPRKRLKTNGNFDEITTNKCKTMENVTGDVVVKSEITEKCQESKSIDTDYEFISVGNVKMELPDYEEFPWDGLEDLGNTENSHPATSLLDLIKTEITEENYDTSSNSSREIEVGDDDVKKDNLTESDTVELNMETNLRKTSGFPCCYCFISETTLENLSLHISRDHYRKQLFICRICSKVVHSAQYHSAHVSRHRMIKCSHCSYEGTSTNLNNHRRIKHSIQETVAASFKFKCGDCDMYFSRSSEQLRHEKAVHRKVQPYLRNHIHFIINQMKS